MSRPEHWFATLTVLDAEGVERDLSCRYATVELRQSHPYGSTTAAETWTETIDDTREWELDDEAIDEGELQSRLAHLDWDLVWWNLSLAAKRGRRTGA